MIFILSAGMLAQSPPRCPADRPVDDIIAEIHKQQSKKANRNPTLLPDATCIFGRCFEHSRTPPTVPEPAPRAEMPSTSGESSSKPPVDKCTEATELAIDAAQNVDVGDYSFSENNYRGALMRYQDAVKEKPSDIAIHVRLGRVYEKLNQLPQAVEEYRTAQKLPGPKKWADEATAALQRLAPAQRSCEPVLKERGFRRAATPKDVGGVIIQLPSVLLARNAETGRRKLLD
jgi:tetratricopeptide (TPR) repeat protein